MQPEQRVPHRTLLMKTKEGLQLLIDSKNPISESSIFSMQWQVSTAKSEDCQKYTCKSQNNNLLKSGFLGYCKSLSHSCCTVLPFACCYTCLFPVAATVGSSGHHSGWVTLAVWPQTGQAATDP